MKMALGDWETNFIQRKNLRALCGFMTLEMINKRVLEQFISNEKLDD
jgi:hypothetical protein